MNVHNEPQIDLPYKCLIESHIEHLLSKYDRLSTADARPQLWFLSATFLPLRHKRTNNVPIPLDRCLAYFDQFYVGLLPKLMSNFERKRHLQPLTYLYGDYPFTKKEKAYAPLTPNEKFNANQFRLYLEHPETNPHVHAVMVLPPVLVDRFKAILPQLEKLFRGLCRTNCTFDATPFEPADIRNVIFYASKLLGQPQVVLKSVAKYAREPITQKPGELSTSFASDDLYTVLPKARREPVYCKPRWERELLAQIKQAQRLRELTPPTITSIEAGTIFKRSDLRR